MVLDLKKDLECLQGKNEFKNYKNENSDSYLCAAFTILEPSKKKRWQIDYYSPKSDKMTAFLIDPIFERKDCNTLHKDNEKIHELNIDNIDIGIDDTLNIVTSLKDKSYSNEKVSKIIVILQNINKKEIWNITYLTESFHVLNVHIDAQSGELLKEKFENILSFNAH
ncbi:hypothetical protein J4231_01800 [Candidatus Woesearchaeota archaeon]|nr:hypothetical protein [Candidatus Woesearchaeota archaeon]